MPHTCIGSRLGQSPGPLGPVEDRPGPGREDEPGSKEDHAQQVERSEMRMGTPSEEHLRQVSSPVGEPIHFRVSALKPPGEEIDRQGKPVHLGEEGNQERAECSKRPPVPPGNRSEDTEGDKDEDRRIEDHQRPETISFHAPPFFPGAGVLFQPVEAPRALSRLARESPPSRPRTPWSPIQPSGEDGRGGMKAR